MYSIIAHAENSLAAGSGSPLATSTSLNVAAADTLIVGVQIATGDAGFLSLSDGLNTYTYVGLGQGLFGASIAYYTVLDAVANAATTVTASVSGGTTLRGIWVDQIRGLSGSAPVFAYQGQNGPGSATDAVSSGTATPGAEPAMVWSHSMDYSSPGSDTQAAGTGFTQLYQGWAAWTGTATPPAVSEALRVTSLTPVAGTFTAQSGIAGNLFTTAVLIYPEAATPGALPLNSNGHPLISNGHPVISGAILPLAPLAWIIERRRRLMKT